MNVNVIEDLKSEMKNRFGSDRKRINHTLKVLEFAQQINSVEKANSLIVAAAAILHDIGIHAAEEKHGSSAAKYQEMKGPPIARQILKAKKFAEADTDHICAIIANHHSAKDIDTPEFRVTWDADWLVNIPDELDLSETNRLAKFIDKTFKTNTGKQITKELFF